MERGLNQYKNYIDETDGKVKACEKVIYEWGDDFRFPVNLYKHIFWFDNDGNHIHSKVVKKKPVSQSKLDDINASIAKRRIKYLENAANNLRITADTLPEPFKTQYNQVASSIDFLFDHYKVYIDSYLLRQSLGFECAIRDETDPSMMGTLSLPVRQPDEFFSLGLTVKQSIIFQLVGDAYIYG